MIGMGWTNSWLWASVEKDVDKRITSTLWRTIEAWEALIVDVVMQSLVHDAVGCTLLVSSQAHICQEKLT